MNDKRSPATNERHTARTLVDMIERDYFPMDYGRNLYFNTHEWMLIVAGLHALATPSETVARDLLLRQAAEILSREFGESFPEEKPAVMAWFAEYDKRNAPPSARVATENAAPQSEDRNATGIPEQSPTTKAAVAAPHDKNGELVMLLWERSNRGGTDADLRSLLRHAADSLEATPSATLAPEEIARLREIEHRAWHMMDDSEENGAGIVTIRPDREDYDTLAKLLSEVHP